jgi:probable F420-dependent oxidoreductase
MDIGLFLNTHGVTMRDDHDWWHQPMKPEEMRPVEAAQLGERLGYHSVWMGDHVGLPEESPESVSPIHREGESNTEVRQRGDDAEDVGGSKRHYPRRPTILDGAVVMGAIAAATEKIKMGPSVLIAPYRHPLSDARQFATIDNMSNGRLLMGVGCGWMKEEFEALGHDFHGQRLKVLEECIDIYHKSWTEGTVSYDGEFYKFENVGMYPLTVRKPRPPIIVGANSKAGARLVARKADALFPLLTRPFTTAKDHEHLKEEVLREADRIGRDPGEIALGGLVSARITGPDDPESTASRRRVCGGTAEQILEDLQTFADAGYSMIAIAPIVPSRTYTEYEEQAEWLGREVLPEAKKMTAQGGWSSHL